MKTELNSRRAGGTHQRLVRAKTCTGCRACEYDAYCNWYCSLGFKMIDRKPQEPCAKPRSITAMVTFSLGPNITGQLPAARKEKS